MDFKSLLSQLDQLNEATEKTKTGLKHTAEPGGYGRKDDEDDEGKKVKSDVKKGRGRPKKDADSSTGEEKKYDFSAFGVKKGADYAGKPKGKVIKGKSQSAAANKVDDGTDPGEEPKEKKKGLKEYFDALDVALNETSTLNTVRDRMQSGQGGALNAIRGNMQQRGAGMPALNKMNQGVQQRLNSMSGKSVEEAEQIQIKPASQVPPKPGQTSQTQPGQQQQVAGQPKKDTQVIQQGDKTLGTVDNPQLAQQIKQSIGKGEMTLMPDEAMEEGVLDTLKKVGGKVLDKLGHGSDED
jgi:hypothetical protein